MASTKNKKVVVAMSGGVDSSTALAILKEQGYDCIAVSMQLWDYSEKDDATHTAGSCCSMDDIYDARHVAEGLGVPFYVVNAEDAFAEKVVADFIEGYAKGLTPNPCIRCNEFLKFGLLLRKAALLGAGFLATGHYARIEAGPAGFKLLKAVDPEKDQSYFLFTMTEEHLSKVLFPLGGLTKKEVRSMAKRLGLRTSDKPESQEVCFVEDARYGAFLSPRISAGKGKISDSSGKVLGTHNGIFNYTVGQRKGLNLSGGPFFVTGIDAPNNRVAVGRIEELYSSGLIAEAVNWVSADARRAFEQAGTLTGVSVKLRYRHEGATATLIKAGNGIVRVVFSEPQKAVVAPGQAAIHIKEEVSRRRMDTKALK